MVTILTASNDATATMLRLLSDELAEWRNTLTANARRNAALLQSAPLIGESIAFRVTRFGETAARIAGRTGQIIGAGARVLTGVGLGGGAIISAATQFERDTAADPFMTLEEHAVRTATRVGIEMGGAAIGARVGVFCPGLFAIGCVPVGGFIGANLGGFVSDRVLPELPPTPLSIELEWFYGNQETGLG